MVCPYSINAVSEHRRLWPGLTYAYKLYVTLALTPTSDHHKQGEGIQSILICMLLDDNCHFFNCSKFRGLTKFWLSFKSGIKLGGTPIYKGWCQWRVDCPYTCIGISPFPFFNIYHPSESNIAKKNPVAILNLVKEGFSLLTNKIILANNALDTKEMYGPENTIHQNLFSISHHPTYNNKN